MDIKKDVKSQEEKKGYQSQSGAGSGSDLSNPSGGSSEGAGKADFDTSDRSASSSETEKGVSDDVRLGRKMESDDEKESELSSREGAFGEGIPPKPEGDQGYGRHSGQSGAI